MPHKGEQSHSQHSSAAALVVRRHPACPKVPYALDLQSMGLHCLLPRLNGPIESFPSLIKFLTRLEVLTSLSTMQREQDVMRIAWTNGSVIGRVYDIPTIPSWALWQKIAQVDIYMQALIGSTQTVYAVPKELALFDDIRPDRNTLPEVSMYTEIASVLYEALDCLMVTRDVDFEDIHLRNLYPYSIWSSGMLASQAQTRLLAPIAPPPRVFSRFLECPVRGELLAVPREVRRHGWIVFFKALVPSYIQGGIQFDVPGMQRFVPRSSMQQNSKAASLLLDDLTFAELYYLIRIEESASGGDMKAVYYERTVFVDHSLGLMDEFLDKSPFCQSRGVRLERPAETGFSWEDRLSSNSSKNNWQLAQMEEGMCTAASEEIPNPAPSDAGEVHFIYKRDARVDVATLDGYDGWSDEELNVKKHKAWTMYTPKVLLPVEVASLFSESGYRIYVSGETFRIVKTSHTGMEVSDDYSLDLVLPRNQTWTTLRPLLAKCCPAGLENSSDRLLLCLLVAGQVSLYGYYFCPDISDFRHSSRGIGVFMDAPLRVIAFKLSEQYVSNRKDERSCLIIPIGPACTMLMRYCTEKYSLLHGRVHHSSQVTILPYGCRLGNRSHLRWYAVGAGPWKPSSIPPRSLVQVVDTQLSALRCSVSAERERVLITAQKGLASVRLRDIGFEAGWSSFSPHLIISGKGKRIVTTVRTESLTHFVDALRRIRDSCNQELNYSIQEIAGMVILKEILIGPLFLTRQPTVGWAPPWKVVEHGFVVPHAIHLPRGVGVREISEDTAGVLITEDTMVVLKATGDQNGVWNISYVDIQADIESEKLLVGPAYEGFIMEVHIGTMRGP